MSIQVCRDTSDAVALYLPQRLYLKPFAKLNISIQLPTHKVHGKSISNWELMEKLRKMIQPDNFSMLKVSKHSSEVIRFDAELENRDKLEKVLARLEDRIIQLNDYPDPLKVKVSEAKTDFPSRHSWDSFFRDATDMDEMKPGERPDTVHIANMPIRWFVHDRDRHEDAPPSESIVKKAFEKYGTIRQVDVPAADPFRLQMKAAMRGISTPPQDAALYFESYIQFSEYVSFVRCMDALRNKKLLRKKDDLAEWCGLRVDFDKTKHMTDAAVKRRAIVRERLVARQRAKDEEEKQEKEKIAKREAKERQKHERAEKEKLDKMREREEKRKKKQLAKLLKNDNIDINSKVAEEQKNLLKAQKKLQAVRLIEELFKRIELRPELQHAASHSYSAGERSARARLVDKLRCHHEVALEAQRDRLKQAFDGRIVLRSALETKKPKRESSISSISSVDEKRIKTERLNSPERENDYNKPPGGMFPPYGYGYAFPYAPYAFPPHPAHPAHLAHLGQPAPHNPQTGMFYGGRMYYAPPESYAPRRGGGRGWGWPRGRARGRGLRIPHFEGPDASMQYYKYFKRLAETESRNEHDNRLRSRSRSRSHSRSRSRSRRRSRSYTRSRSRSRSHSRRRYSRSRSRRSRSRSRRSRSRRTRSRSRRSRSHHSRSRSRSRKRSKSRSHSRRLKSPKNKLRTPTPEEKRARVGSNTVVSPSKLRPRDRSKSWSLPKNGDNRKSWSKSPKEK